MTPIIFTIQGEPASKANSRQIVRNASSGLPMVIKSKKARVYSDLVAAQAPVQAPLLEGDLSITLVIYYASRRPDLDPSVILDALQGKVYRNDRQVKEIHAYHGIDRDNPRAEVRIEER